MTPSKLRNLLCLILLISFLLPLPGQAQKRLVQQIARQFRPPAVLVLHPEYVFRKNNKSGLIKGFNNLTPAAQDSILFYSSKFMQYLDDTGLLQSFTGSLASELETYGFTVFPEHQLDTFFLLQEPAMILSLAQLEIEEDQETISEEDVFDDTLNVQKSFTLNYLRLNAWFELSVLNADSIKPEVLFSSFYMQDQLKGRFWRHPLKMDVQYRYKLLEIRQEDITGLAVFAGKKNASYLFDYLLNKSLSFDDRINHGRYWHYNRLTGSVKDAGENRFTILGEEGN